MLIEQFLPGKSIQIKSPAKLNLVLEVLGKRPDGFHEIATILCPISLWDQIEISLEESNSVALELKLPAGSSSTDPAWQIPSDDRNLVVRAANIVRETLGCSTGCRIRMKKNIPAAAGLGGGSGNAAAMIVAGLLLWSRWNRHLAGELCERLGSDVNFFLGSEQGFGMTLAEGRGERTHLLEHRPPLAFWLTHPGVGCSTAEVYSRVVETGRRQKISDFLDACETGQESKIGAALSNTLQLPASQLNSWIGIQLQLLKECGCCSRLMTGSGSCCFGLVPTGGLFGLLEYKAKYLGIPRTIQTTAWYGDSLEHQLARIGPDENLVRSSK